MRYVGIVRKTTKSDFAVEFPDLPGCISVGSDLVELEDMAAEALDLHLEGLRDEGLGLPEASSLADIEGMLGHQRGADFFALIPFEVRVSERAKRVNITIPERLLVEIDRYAEVNGLTRSGFLVDAARRALRG